jgi:adenylate cyclase class IV
MPRILETKARYADLGRARRLLADAGGDHEGAVQQEDTYFHVPEGWLKLRTHGGGAELVAYGRTPGSAAHTCTFAVTAICDADACRDGLTAVLGVRAVVRKRREVWTLGPTTVHLDDVDRLGTFVELETPANEASERMHVRCAVLLGIATDTDLLTSYADLLATA